MPTYDYACASCGNQYEKREGFDAKPRQKCPKCGKMAQRMLSLPAVVFKGTGFYKTDSRGSSSAPGESGASGDSAPATTPATTPAVDGGHSHGPGGHTHDTPSPTTTPTTPATTPTTATTSEPAAAT